MLLHKDILVKISLDKADEALKASYGDFREDYVKIKQYSGIYAKRQEENPESIFTLYT